MWILQEYRFYLIIAVIALAAIIALFFSTQNSQELVDFNTNVKSNFAQIKGQASEQKSMYDVVTVDSTTFRGMKNDQLFGLTHKFISDLGDSSTTTDATVSANAGSGVLLVEANTQLATAKTAAGTFAVVFVAGDEINDATGADDSKDAYTGDDLSANDNTASMKGWNLSAGGSIAYVFESNKVAKDVMSEYIPEGTLNGNSVIVPFLQ